MSLLPQFKINSLSSQSKSLLSSDFNINNSLNEIASKVRKKSNIVSIDGFIFDYYENLNISHNNIITKSPTSKGSIVLEHLNYDITTISMVGYIYKHVSAERNEFDELTQNVQNRIGQISAYFPQYAGDANNVVNETILNITRARSFINTTIGSAKGFYGEVSSYFGKNDAKERHIENKEKLLSMRGKKVRVIAGGIEFSNLFVIEKLQFSMDNSNSFDTLKFDIQLCEWVEVEELTTTTFKLTNRVDGNINKQIKTAQEGESIGKVKNVSFIAKRMGLG